MIQSSVAPRYKPGFGLHADSDTAQPKAVAPQGACELATKSLRQEA